MYAWAAALISSSQDGREKQNAAISVPTFSPRMSFVMRHCCTPKKSLHQPDLLFSPSPPRALISFTRTSSGVLVTEGSSLPAPH